MSTSPFAVEAWPEVSAAFDALAEQSPAQRQAWLALWRPAHPQALAWLEQLLAAQAQAADVGPSPSLLQAALSGGAAAPAWQPGQRVGPFELLAPLGQGGMAQVWRAAQRQGVQREVALKLPRVGLEAPQALRRRFARERDLLASLEHPHIARLYDAGVSEAGQPWLAMECIEGRPITEHLQGRPLVQRLLLFQQVLDAVAFAHGRMVIHRDLKPSNILVDANGRVKLLDFGIAQLLDAAPEDVAAAELLEPDPTLSADGHRPAPNGSADSRALTPDAAAPEQLRGEPPGVQADVYALGVLLYQLLCGQRPYHLERDAGLSLWQQWQAQAWAAPSALAQAPALARALRGDLDAVVARAMAEHVKDRYASVEALAQDLQRWQECRPVLARQSPGWQRWGLALRRHRYAFAAGTAVALALSVGLGAALWQAHEARQQAQRALAVKGFLLQVFSAADVRQANLRPSGQTTARELLGQARARVEKDFAHDPALRIELLGVLANIYGHLGEDEAFSALLEQWIAQAQQHHGVAHPATIDARLTDVYADIYSLNYANARKSLAELDGHIRDAGLDEAMQRASWQLASAEVLRATPGAEAQRLAALQEAQKRLQRLAPGSESLQAAYANAGVVHNALENWREARKALELALAVPLAAGESLENLPIIHTALGHSLMHLGETALAQVHLDTAIEKALASAGPGNVGHDNAVAAKARWLHRAGELAQARRLFDSLALAKSPADKPRRAKAREWEMALWLDQGLTADAVVGLRVLLKIAQDSPLQASDVRRVQGLLAQALWQQGERAEARALAEAAWTASQQWDGEHTEARALAQRRWEAMR